MRKTWKLRKFLARKIFPEIFRGMEAEGLVFYGEEKEKQWKEHGHYHVIFCYWEEDPPSETELEDYIFWSRREAKKAKKRLEKEKKDLLKDGRYSVELRECDNENCIGDNNDGPGTFNKWQ